MVQKLNGRSNGRTVARKREILRSAAAAFRRKGFSGASMEDISDALGMTKGSLYYYFRNKQDLLYFCQEHSLNRMLEEVGRIRRTIAPVDDQLRMLVDAHLRCILDELDGAGAHLDVAALPAERLARIVAKRDRYEDELRKLIRKGIRMRAFVETDDKMVAMAILGALNWCATWYRPDGPLRPEQISGAFSALFIKGLLRRR